MPIKGGAEAHIRTAGEDVSEVSEPLVGDLRLHNFPNPFNPKTKLVYNLPRQEHVQLKLYDVRGRLVRILIDDVQVAGPQTVVWDGRDAAGRAMPSGVYFARLKAGDLARNHKLILVK
jgi:hypothetical protein